MRDVESTSIERGLKSCSVPQVRAGFHSSLYGPFPFFVARLPGEGMAIIRLRKP